MSLYPIQDAFIRGELTPRLHARASLDLYKVGLSRCENFITMPHGGLRKRGGTYFVNEVKDSTKATRLIRFVFSDDQAYVLEAGAGYIRVYAYGARVGSFEIVTPYTEADLPDLRFRQSADVLWIVHPQYAVRKITRLTNEKWDISIFVFEGGPFAAENTDTAVTAYASAATGTITLTASSSIFDATRLGHLFRIDMSDYADIQPWEPGALISKPTVNTLRRYDGNVYITPTSRASSAVYDVKTGGTPPTHLKGIEWDGQGAYEEVSDSGTVIAMDYYHGLQWKYLHSGFGVARITGITSGTVATATVITEFPSQTVGSGKATSKWRFEAFDENNHPDNVTIFEERLVLSRRFSVFLSKTGVFTNFRIGPKGDDALAFTLGGGGEANDISWLAEKDGFLTIGTIGGVRALSGGGIDEALTPSSFKNRTSNTMPCGKIAPVSTGSSFVYVPKGGKKIAELRLGQQLRFESDDIGQISEHIPKKGVVRLGFQESPDPIIWFPVANGELGGLTYQPSQEVRGMHRHQLGGDFEGSGWGIVEDLVVTPGQDGQDDVWMIVKRTINGGTKRYIEIMAAPFEYGDIKDCFAVDCALSRDSGAAVNSVSGLSHLAVEQVDVLADGIIYRDLAVTGAGVVSLPGAVTAVKWRVGLPYAAEAATLELDVGGRDGSIIGRKKRLVSVILSLFETDISSLKISSVIKGRLEIVKLPSIAIRGAAASLFTGNVTVPVDDSWEGMGKFVIHFDGPTPCTIRAAIPVFDSES